MKRRDFITKGIVSGTLMSSPVAAYAASYDLMNAPKDDRPLEAKDDVVIERPAKGRPHEGKVLAAVQPHCDDIALFAAGTVAKLLHEGYTGYLIRTSNGDAAGQGSSAGERVYNNEQANNIVAKALGFKKVYNLGYRNHRMDGYNIQDLKGRLIFLFRLLKIDTVISYDPWGHYEENPDHYVTAKAVETARWMSGMGTDYPEQLEVVEPHSVSERYYFARGPQLVNRIVDISEFIDKKIEANQDNTLQGPGGNAGFNLKKRLEKEGKRLPILGKDADTANYNYIKNILLDMDSKRLRGIPSDKETGAKYGLDWAECFHYMGPEPSGLDEYIKKNAVSI